MDNIIKSLTRRIDNLELFIQANLKNKAFAQLYEDDLASTLTVVAAGTYYPIILTPVAGLYNIMSYNTSLGRIICEERSEGTYLLAYQISNSCAHNSTEVHAAIFKNGIKLPQACSEIFFQNASSELSSSAIGIATLVENDYIDLRLTSNKNGEVIDISHLQLTAYRIR